MTKTIKSPSGLEFANCRALRDELKANIIKACRVRGVLPANIQDDDLLISGSGALQLDSMDAIEIAVMVDRVYGVKIKDLSSAKVAMRSVATLGDHVWKALGGDI